VLNDLYQRWKDTPSECGFISTLRRIGRSTKADGIDFDDDAPLAAGPASHYVKAIGSCNNPDELQSGEICVARA
jgi:hypothetical protein